jgi:hypothetical protein
MDQFSFGARDNGIIQIAYTVADIQSHAPLHRASSRRAVVLVGPFVPPRGSIAASPPRCGSASTAFAGETNIN